MKKPLAVLDTNVFVSGLILPKSIPSRILHLWKTRVFDVVISDPMLEELEAVLWYPKLRKKYALDTFDVGDFIRNTKKRSVYVPVVRKPDVAIRDPKDLIILASALSGRADYLVTGDKDLLTMKLKKSVGPLLILTPAQFLERIQS